MLNWISILDKLKLNMNNFLEKFLISLLVLIIITVVIKIINAILKKLLSRKNRLTGVRIDEMRAKTLVYLLSSVITYTLYGVGFFYILTLFFGSVGITVAGIGSVAIGFGAQGLVKDIISGIFILIEDKYKIGEYVTISGHSGTVEQIGMRTTILRDFNGDIHSIPNGNIEEVTNVSRGNRRFLVDVTVSSEESLEKVIEALNEAIITFKKTHDSLIDGPNVMGVVNIRDLGPTLRVQGRAEYKLHWTYENDLRKEIVESFQRHSIKSPKIFSTESGMLK